MKKLVFLLALLSVVAFAGDGDLLVLHCEGGSCYIADISGYSYYDSVTYVDGTYTLVPVSTLINYGAVFSWNNYQYQSGQGDNLGTYVTGNDGKVCLLIWGISQCYGSIINDASLCPISGGGNQYSSTNLGTVYDASHPCMDGDAGTVTTISGMYYWVSGSMESGATRVADNSNGTPLVAVNVAETCAALNICPGPYKYWSGDGWKLMNNTMQFLMEGSVPDTDPPYVNGMDPDDGETDVPVDSTIVFHCVDDLSKIDTDTIDFTARDTTLSGGRSVSSSASVSVAFDSTRSIAGDLDIDDTDPKDVVCTFTASDDLNGGDTISCTVAAGLADSRDNEMADDFVWTFDTASGPAVTETTWGAIKADF